MKKRHLLILYISLIVLFVILTFPVQPTQATGPTLEEGDDGFDPPTWVNNITYINPFMAMMANISQGDQYRFFITSTNNSQLDFIYVQNPSWIGDVIWVTIQYYNNTDKSLTTIPERPLAAYNSTNPYSDSLNSWYPGKYYCYSYNFIWIGEPTIYPQNFPLIPTNFTAANHTIVNQTYSHYMMMNELLSINLGFQYSGPKSSIAGKWVLQYGDPSTLYSVKEEYTFNNQGIMVKHQMYTSTGTSWMLMLEVNTVSEKTTSEPSEPGISSDLLLLAMLAADGGMDISIVIGLSMAGGIGVGIVIGLIIGYKKK